MQVGTDAAFSVPFIEKPPHCCGVETTMPTFRKVDPIEIEPKSPPLSKRSQVTREYDDYLDSFAVGDYGRAALFNGERASARAPALAGRSPPAWPRAALPFRPWPADLPRRGSAGGGQPDDARSRCPARRGCPARRFGQARASAPTTASPMSDSRRAVSRGAAALDARGTAVGPTRGEQTAARAVVSSRLRMDPIALQQNNTET